MARAVLYADGASRGNPGEAAIGVSLQDEEGREVATISRALGLATNNQAEYTALLEGLKLAQKHKVRDLKVRADSELIVRQMTGKYRVKDAKLKPLHEEAQRVAASFEQFQIEHVPREENTRADELANEALDGEL